MSNRLAGIVKLLWTSIVTVTILFTSPTLALAKGPGTTGGGSGTAAEFVSLAGEVLRLVREHKELFPEVDTDALAQAIAETQVFSVNRQLVNPIGSAKSRRAQTALEIDAINIPEQKVIKVSVPTWKKLTYTKKILLVFHEYLSVMGLEKGTYAISNRLRKFLKPGELDSNFYSFLGKADLGNGKLDLLVLEQLADDRLLVIETKTQTHTVLLLDKEAASKLKALDSRDWGHHVSLTLTLSHNTTLTIRGDSCGRLRCDSAEVTSKSGKENVTAAYEQPIHGWGN